MSQGTARAARVQLSVYLVSIRWRSELGWDTPSRYQTSAGTPERIVVIILLQPEQRNALHSRHSLQHAVHAKTSHRH